jgi:DNA-binding beta-propeller fold protein YncE
MIAIIPDGSQACVTNKMSDTVSVIDTATNVANTSSDTVSVLPLPAASGNGRT